MGQFDQQLKLSIGGSNFQLRDWSYSSSPIVESGKGRTGTRVTLSGEGWVQADATDGTLASQVASAVASFSISRQLITVSEYGVVMASIVPGQCTDGGPHIDFQVVENIDYVMGGRNFKFSAKAEQQINPGEPTNSYTIDTTVTPDTLRIVVIKGDVTGAGAGAFYTATVLPAFAQQYPVAAGWVMLHEVNNNQTNDKSTYTITFTELSKPFSESLGQATDPVEGEATIRRERDQQMRLTTHYSYDMLLKKGEDPVKLLDVLRPKPAEDILSESSETTVHHGVHLRAEFVMLNSANGNYLMDFQQSFSQSKSATTVTSVEFPGLAPLLVLTPAPAVRYVQEGRAVGYKKFYPGPEFYLPYMESQPVIKHAYLSDFEYETTWTITYIAATPIDQTTFRSILKDLLRPAAPTMF